ncbi:hypothetical protein GW17_00036399 [Ensete ventricosum]|nr:hypothetical protein GW17_00036399 [Ensete ventricosum]
MFLSRYGFTIFLDCVDDSRDRFDSNERRFTIALHRWRKVAALRDEKHKWHSQVLKVVTAEGRLQKRVAGYALRCCWANLSKTEKEKRKQSNVSMDAIGSDDCRR